MKKFLYFSFLVFLVFSCKHKAKDDGRYSPKKVEVLHVKKVTVAGEDVDMESWKARIRYRERALEKNDFEFLLSIKGAPIDISPLPLKIRGGESARVTISSPSYGLSQKLEITMDRSQHKVHFSQPSEGNLKVVLEDGSQVLDGADVDNSTILKLIANHTSGDYVVDSFIINGKKMLYGKNPAMLEVRDDVDIKVSFTKKVELSFVSVVDAGKTVVVKKDKWVDYFDWEDYPDVYVSPYAIGRTEVSYPLWKKIYAWAVTKGYVFNNQGQNACRFVSNTDVEPFPESDANIYPATGMSQMDMWAWCNALTEYTNEQHSGEEGYVPLTYVYKHDGARPPYQKGEPFKKSDVYFPKLTFPVPPEAYTWLQNAIDTANSIIIDRNETGYRLPTRTEWIFAGRGGNPDDDAWKYIWPGSNVLEDVTHYFVPGSGTFRTLYPICSKIPNTLGIYDMVGNCDEWSDSKHPQGPLANDVLGHSSTDKKEEFYQNGWFQDVGGGLGYPWGGSANLGGGTNGWAVTGFRLAFTLK